MSRFFVNPFFPPVFPQDRMIRKWKVFL